MSDLQRHTLFLFKGHYERLADLHPAVTPAEVIRTLVANHIKRVEDAVPAPKIEINDKSEL